MFNGLNDFYSSREWAEFRRMLINERTKDDGFIYDEVTGKPIMKSYDIILHHVIHLTEENVFDYNISLNPENIQIVSHKTHNYIHNKLGYSRREVFLVYGAPLSGKTSWVNESKNEGDLIIDIDDIWQAVSGCDRYIKPNRLRAVVFRVRDTLMDAVRYRLGKWQNAYIVGGYPLSSERERLIKELGAREIFIRATKEECLARLETDEARSKIEGYAEFITTWFDRYIPAPSLVSEPRGDVLHGANESQNWKK